MGGKYGQKSKKYKFRFQILISPTIFTKLVQEKAKIITRATANTPNHSLFLEAEPPKLIHTSFTQNKNTQKYTSLNITLICLNTA